jgi:hypothetical protein
MGRTRSQQDAELAALYARIPAIPDCDGRCWTSCGPIDMSWRERSRIRSAGVRITPYEDARAWSDTFYCEALTEGKRCAVYDMRPLVCRLWGAVDGLRCPFGCVPEGGWLSDEDAYRMIAESMRIGGHSSAADPGAVDAGLARPEVREALARIRERGRRGDAQRVSETVPAAFRARPRPG